MLLFIYITSFIDEKFPLFIPSKAEILVQEKRQLLCMRRRQNDISEL